MSLDGRWLATGGFKDRLGGTARIWDAATLEQRQSLDTKGNVTAVAFSPDSHTLLTAAADKTARLWTVQNGAIIGPTAYHLKFISGAAFSPDGSRIITCGDDGVCQLHLVRNARSRWLEIPLSDEVGCVGMSRDGRVALTGTKPINQPRGEVQLWDSFTGGPLGAWLTRP